MDLTAILPQTTLIGIVEYKDESSLNNRNKAYNHIFDTLGERQKSVFNHLNDKFPNGATAKELSVSMFRNHLVPSPERNSVHPRLNELIAVGLISVIGKKKCEYTSRSVALYKCK
jgi:hypothetical protein